MPRIYKLIWQFMESPDIHEQLFGGYDNAGEAIEDWELHLNSTIDDCRQFSITRVQ